MREVETAPAHVGPRGCHIGDLFFRGPRILRYLEAIKAAPDALYVASRRAPPKHHGLESIHWRWVRDLPTHVYGFRESLWKPAGPDVSYGPTPARQLRARTAICRQDPVTAGHAKPRADLPRERQPSSMPQRHQSDDRPRRRRHTKCRRRCSRPARRVIE